MTAGDAAGVAPGARRSLRRLLETRGLLGGHTAPHAHVRLWTSDEVLLTANYLPRPGAGEVAVLLVHGFAAHRRKPSYARLADAFSKRFPVLALDLRGHGQSRGTCTLGRREGADVAAGVRWLTSFGHPRVVVVAASMGATAALQAVASGAPAAALVLISTPGPLDGLPHGPEIRRLRRLWHSPVQRAALRTVTGVALAAPDACRPFPNTVVMAAAVRCPLLLVHGDDDAYVPSATADDLLVNAAGSARLWREPEGFGHAEDGFTEPFVSELVAAVAAAARSGVFPPRRPVQWE